MATPKIPSQKGNYQKLNSRLDKYVALVEEVYKELNDEAAKAVASTDYGGDKPFKWKDYPQTTAKVKGILSQFVDDMETVIHGGTSTEWKNSNTAQDLIANNVLKSYGARVNGGTYETLYQTNPDALEAFQKRKDNGMSLSRKLWDQSEGYKSELEAAISCAVQKGTSAITLSKRISQYLLDFPSLQKDYKELFGTAANIHDCEYRSARLARSEINMAYRAAENERWKQMDFVVGMEIKTTRNGKHEEDVCDTLAGKYPKDFEWTGWHVNCRCYKIPIMKTEEEFWADGTRSTSSVNEVRDVPDNFKQWCKDNRERIEAAEKRGTLPYFVRDNKETVDKWKVEGNKWADIRKEWEIQGREYDFSGGMASKFDFAAFKHQMSDIGMMYGFTIDKWSVSFAGEDSFSISLGTTNGGGLTLERTFYKENGDVVVSHDLMDVANNLQGKGVSKRVFRALYQQYKAIGVNKIKVFANKDVGGYCWSNYGFKAEDIGEALRSVSGAAKELRDDIQSFIESYYDKSKLGGEQPFPMWLIAEKFGKEKAKMGLMGGYWNGVLDFGDKLSVETFERYIGVR